ncbi:hypothetical protein IID62_10780, partial [candidate division KSB1 bacterium]|nr:hypothetical protein [candidate division KSB1 bacterium]
MNNNTVSMQRNKKWFTDHTKSIVILAFIAVVLMSVYPFLMSSDYKSSSDLHATIEVIGSLFGLITGLVFIMRFNILGNRIHLLIGMAFFANALEDLA